MKILPSIHESVAIEVQDIIAGVNKHIVVELKDQFVLFAVTARKIKVVTVHGGAAKETVSQMRRPPVLMPPVPWISSTPPW